MNLFGTNSITGKSFFKDAGNTLLVTSRFLTLQGEGPFQGRPALFIRLTKCQLQCLFCDTFFDEGTVYKTKDLVSEVLATIASQYFDFRKCGVVVTGGEPSLQKEVCNFLFDCIDQGVAFTQVESNGLLPFDNLPKRTVLVVSPKCNENIGRYLHPHEQNLQDAGCLKFVVSADKNSPYNTIPDWAFEWQQETGKPIYISPMNMYRPVYLEMARQRVKERKEHNIDYRSTVDEVISGWDDTILDREQNMLNHQYAAQYAIEKGLWLTLQMQLYASVA